MSLEAVNDPVTPASGDAYIALLGRSTWALVNAYHAVLHEKGLRPERVIIVTEEPYAREASIAAEAIGTVSEGYGFAPAIKTEILPEADFVRAGQTIRSLAGDLIRQGFDVAIDITSGRKVTVAGALIAVSVAGLDIRHIYYLAMKSTDDVAKPYMMIPHQIQQIRDIMEDAGARE
ncbi:MULTISPECIES: hypothetical protein [Methanoculleus]|uniref:Uncharacterized protein n=1 Tax=Methanoculleus submarinus TaxID=204050 RepID=A0AAX3E9T6_9EURY|nr:MULTISPECIES: hypothetical protein [Methanoculleus]UYU18867.1 hypothetical protein OH143_01880 [Methanoculleus submarinus]